MDRTRAAVSHSETWVTYLLSGNVLRGALSKQKKGNWTLVPFCVLSYFGPQKTLMGQRLAYSTYKYVARARKQRSLVYGILMRSSGALNMVTVVGKLPNLGLVANHLVTCLLRPPQ